MGTLLNAQPPGWFENGTSFASSVDNITKLPTKPATNYYKNTQLNAQPPGGFEDGTSLASLVNNATKLPTKPATDDDENTQLDAQLQFWFQDGAELQPSAQCAAIKPKQHLKKNAKGHNKKTKK